MTTKELIAKIRAEIERRIKQWHCFEFVDEMLKGPNGNDGFLSFLDTLEEPVSEDQPLLNLEIPAGDVAPAEEEGGPFEGPFQED